MMHRAAKRARRRAMETIGAVAVFKDGKVVWEKADGTFDVGNEGYDNSEDTLPF